MAFSIIFLVMLAFWIYAERRLGVAVRVASGIACMVFIACSFYFIASIMPSYERTFHKSSIRLSGELIAKGETQRVQQAISTYTNIAATGTTYRAAMQMWDVLNHGPKE